jgi:hypothetical protein
MTVSPVVRAGRHLLRVSQDETYPPPPAVIRGEDRPTLQEEWFRCRGAGGRGAVLGERVN